PVGDGGAPEPLRAQGGVDVTETAHPFAIDAAVAAVAEGAPRRRRGFDWLSLFLSAAGGLILMALLLAVENFVWRLLQDNPPLGYVALGLAALAAIGLVGFLLREAISVMRAARIEKLAARVAAARLSDDLAEGRRLARDLVALYARRPETARGRARLENIDADLVDARARLAIAERELLATPDAEARAAVAAAASRVALVTTISPRALVDVLFVLTASVALVRRVSEIYGGRPGLLGFARVARHVLSHLTVTGGIAIGEGFAQQVLGAGVAARLSAKLGEGVINGMLTARVGLSAIAVCRPMGFDALPAPTLSDVAGSLVKSVARA
ncbi:MAG: TIGR01620 family protein, partial [Rhizobiales bacterium]|nr:TIGR01620 family protein [Hyphomicrobiales bacterium]